MPMAIGIACANIPTAKCPTSEFIGMPFSSSGNNSRKTSGFSASPLHVKTKWIMAASMQNASEKTVVRRIMVKSVVLQ